MTPEERNLLSDLFNNLRDVESQPRDQDAERYIQQLVQGQPAAPYYMAQSVLVQQQALTAAQKRIEDLEQQVRDAQSRAAQPQPSGGGSFLSNALGLGRSPWAGRPEEARPTPGPAYNPVPPAGGGRGPWGATPPQPGVGQPGYGQPGYGQSGGYGQPGYAPPPQAQAFAPRGGGGFLSGAAQTAAGVAGGVLAASAISSLLNHSPGPFGSAMAAPAPESGETVINNYYNDSGDGGNDPGFPPDDSNAQNTDYQNADYQGDDPGLGDPSFDDGGGGDDESWT